MQVQTGNAISSIDQKGLGDPMISHIVDQNRRMILSSIVRSSARRGSDPASLRRGAEFQRAVMVPPESKNSKSKVAIKSHKGAIQEKEEALLPNVLRAEDSERL